MQTDAKKPRMKDLEEVYFMTLYWRELAVYKTHRHVTIHLGLNTKGTGHATLPAK